MLTVIINELFKKRLNFIHNPGVAYTPSTTRRCIAQYVGLENGTMLD